MRKVESATFEDLCDLEHDLVIYRDRLKIANLSTDERTRTLKIIRRMVAQIKKLKINGLKILQRINKEENHD